MQLEPIDKSAVIEDAPDGRVPVMVLAAAAAMFVVAAIVLIARQDEVPGRDSSIFAVVLAFAWIAAAGGAAAGSARLHPGARHGYNFHYLAALPGLGTGWIFASDFATRHPFGVAMAFPAAAAYAVGVVAGTTVTRPRLAGAIAVLVAALMVAALRPFHYGIANLLFAFPPAFAAWWVAVELRRPSEDGSGVEAPMTRTGTMYLVLSVTCVAVWGVILWMIFDASMSGFMDMMESGDGMAIPAQTQDANWSDIAMRFGMAVVAATVAGVVASLRWLRSADPWRAAASAFAASCAVVLGGQAPGGVGGMIAFMAACVVGVGCGFGFGGGVHPTRWQRPVMAAMLAALLGMNLVEPKPVPFALSNMQAALPALVEGTVLALIGAAFYWFVLVKVRDRFVPPIPRRKYLLKDLPPMPPGAKISKY